MHMLDARGPSRDHHGPRCTPRLPQRLQVACYDKNENIQR